MSQLSNLDSYNITYSFALYGAVMGIAILSLVGVIFIKCFNMISCRYMLHLLCLLSFLLAILLFLLAAALSSSMAGVWYSCTYFSTTFTDPASFTTMVNNLVGTEYGSLATYFS